MEVTLFALNIKKLILWEIWHIMYAKSIHKIQAGFFAQNKYTNWVLGKVIIIC